MKRLSCLAMVVCLAFWFGTSCYADEYGEDEGQFGASALTLPIETAIVGIWQIAGQPVFVSVNVNGIFAIGVMYGGGEGYMVGTLSGNTCSMYDASGLSQYSATFTLTSDTTGKLKINECVPLPGFHCLLPEGMTVNAVKVF